MKNICILLLALLITTSCRKFIEIDTPTDRLVREKVFEEDATAISAMGGLYVSMMSDANLQMPFAIALYSGLYSDELEYKVTDLPRLSLYHYSLESKDAITNSIWTRGYFYIYQANSIIEGLVSGDKVTEGVKKQLMGESLFLRAFWHFYLLNLYGDIPIAISTDYTVNGRLERSSLAQVYRQIEADLLKAEQLLPDKYVAANSISETVERFRPNSYVSKSLLARVYLYQGMWDKAVEKSGQVIDKSSTYILEPIENVFKKASKEAIWQLPMPTGASNSPLRENTYEQRFILISRPTPTNSGSDLSTHFLSLFSKTDLRRAKWIKTFTDATGTYNFPFKYQSRAISTVDEHSIAIRFAELLLLSAEAHANNDHLLEAIVKIDQIRSRAGISLLKNIKPSITKEALLDSISVERQRELFCEWGHRWFDIKRSKNANAIMTEIAARKGEVWSTNFLMWPIPLNDIVNNNNLKQNDGYN